MSLVFVSAGQISDRESRDDDYKDAASHEKFRRRRLAVAAWQINQLKQGALVVRLNTSQMAIDGLKRQGMAEMAEKVRLEQAAVNYNIIRAYLDHYKFSKVYFVYSNRYDSLLKGARSGRFVDTTLKEKPGITMNEKFYLLAESDYVYNSSIGFVPEDSAIHVVERGNPSSSEHPIVVKNRYGHQLKNPFPYTHNRRIYPKIVPLVYLNIEGKTIPFNVAGRFGESGLSQNDRDAAGGRSYKINGRSVELSIPRMYTYEALSEVIRDFNAGLNEFYRESAQVDEKSKDFTDAKPFFY